MADAESETTPKWRLPKACEECRTRKIKCSGENPCKTCRMRRTPCLYREVVRQRKKKHESIRGSNRTEERLEDGLSASRPESGQPGLHREEPPLSFNNSVSATHMTSSSNKVQLYYGSTSHFSLMHEIYRDLTSHPAGHPEQGPHGRVEEAGAGLDMLSFRTIFFGIPADPHKDPSRGSSGVDPHVMFLSYELASLFLDAFLSTLYGLLPVWPTEVFRQRLKQLYGPRAASNTETYHSVFMMALALGALVSEHHAWGDILYERVKASCNVLDDTVNLQTVQLFMFMISFLSCSLRLALTSARPLSERGGEAKLVLSSFGRCCAKGNLRCWICFHLGRPSSLSRRDVGIPTPQDPFCLALLNLSEAMVRSADELYGRHHESLLQMWRIAKSIWDDVRPFDSKMKRALGFGLDKRPQPGGVGVQQTMCITLYYHTILLTFRPFLIFRGRWNQGRTQAPEEAKTKREIPDWLNQACGSCFALIFDLIHGQDLAASHLPWIYATLKALKSMYPADAVDASIRAIQTILKQLDPSYEWGPPTQTEPRNPPYAFNQNHAPSTIPRPYGAPPMQHHHSPSTLTTPLPQPDPLLYDFQGNSLDQGMHMPSTTGSTGTGEDLLDFTLSDMGWDFDFSTMDLETFCSLNSVFDVPMA
ncbi:Zn(II)2Cys6 transcription factor [Aspergillus mulundensis]|uniref:Putative Zn(II)2Cys6 transcription factor n=1 Tax=Aspergillus mulundensis TaxID=1810919 RepID=A0A3D8SKW6_9EURO|nr:putative Zn(II)2Cys6 transcription factor [Aspergillus mulundensis]RDW86969.1 putative Zn(II)2Cys6 transcription factor [Aspergillus mulundensis]